MMLEAYYEPQFSDHSHGFRPGRGCHTALREIYYHWKGTTWFIEGDIRGCFDASTITVLLSILREKILDQPLPAADREPARGWIFGGVAVSRDPKRLRRKGAVLSPILANIYLDRLDAFVESTLLPTYNRGDATKAEPGLQASCSIAPAT